MPLARPRPELPPRTRHRTEPASDDCARNHETSERHATCSRADAQPRLLFDMDSHLMRLRASAGETDPAVIGLTGTYRNLLRLWADA